LTEITWRGKFSDFSEQHSIWDPLHLLKSISANPTLTLKHNYIFGLTK